MIYRPSRRLQQRFSGLGQADSGTAGPLPGPNAPNVQYVEDWYIYGINFLALANASTAIGNILVDADSAFKLVKISQQADVAAAGITVNTNPVPLCTLQIVDSGAGRQLFSTPIAFGALFGTGPLPHILPVPRIFNARSNIAITVVNYDAAQTYNLRLAFEGYKIFQLGGLTGAPGM